MLTNWCCRLESHLKKIWFGQFDVDFDYEFDFDFIGIFTWKKSINFLKSQTSSDMKKSDKKKLFHMRQHEQRMPWMESEKIEK